MLYARSRMCIVLFLASSSISLVRGSFSRLFFMSIRRIASLRSMLSFASLSFSFSAASAAASISSFVLTRLRSFRYSYSCLVRIFGLAAGPFEGTRRLLAPFFSLILPTCQICEIVILVYSLTETLHHFSLSLMLLTARLASERSSERANLRVL